MCDGSNNDDILRIGSWIWARRKGCNITKLICSGYLQNINKNKISKVPKFPHCAKFFTAIIQNGRVFGLKWSRQMRVCLGKMWYIVGFSGF